MQLIKYAVRFINTNGSITHGANVEFIDSTTKKQVQAAVAADNQRAVDNVIVTELSREAL